MSLPVFLWHNRSDAKHPGEIVSAGNAALSWAEFSIQAKSVWSVATQQAPVFES